MPLVRIDILEGRPPEVVEARAEHRADAPQLDLRHRLSLGSASPGNLAVLLARPASGMFRRDRQAANSPMDRLTRRGEITQGGLPMNPIHGGQRSRA
jgi:hypothetical protein